ncbi:MAG: hypothetical protein HY394_04110 [Candidatus Diapherotrites archaeon]|nr:hypothetical protein [Candidatus Diapherotrites archaeon]
MVEKKHILILFALIAIGTGAFAFSGGFGPIFGSQAAQDALKAGDYAAFTTAIASTPRGEKAAQNISQDQFKAMSANFKQAGEFRQKMDAWQQSVQKALDDNNYQEWVNAMNAKPKPKSITDVITSGNFTVYVKYQKALHDKDFTTAKTLAQQLGLDALHPGVLGFHAFGPGNGFHAASKEKFRGRMLQKAS